MRKFNQLCVNSIRCFITGIYHTVTVGGEKKAAAGMLIIRSARSTLRVGLSQRPLVCAVEKE